MTPQPDGIWLKQVMSFNQYLAETCRLFYKPCQRSQRGKQDIRHSSLQLVALITRHFSKHRGATEWCMCVVSYFFIIGLCHTDYSLVDSPKSSVNLIEFTEQFVQQVETWYNLVPADCLSNCLFFLITMCVCLYVCVWCIWFLICMLTLGYVYVCALVFMNAHIFVQFVILLCFTTCQSG